MRPTALVADVERARGRARASSRARRSSCCRRSSRRRGRSSGAGRCASSRPSGCRSAPRAPRRPRRDCAQAVADGADALDVVVSLPLLANGDFPAARDELAGAVAAAAGAAPGGPADRRARGHRDVLPRARGLAAGGAAGAGRRLRRRRLRHRSRPRGRHARGDRGAARRAAARERVVKAQGGIRSLADAQRALDAGADLLGVADPAGLLAELAGGACARGGGARCSRPSDPATLPAPEWRNW